MLAEATVYIVGIHVAVNDCEIQKVLFQYTTHSDIPDSVYREYMRRAKHQKQQSF